MLKDRAGDREGAEQLYRQAADRGSTAALEQLARLRERAGDREGAEQLARQAADRGSTVALDLVALWRHRDGDCEGAEQLRRFGLTDDGNPADSVSTLPTTDSST
ncbi:hypothetical protein BG844_09150 [Couchioplanes caeruleus subsp. caeruleus]|uniref:Sel1 repeat family protein n=1 Tax=Couchioplanes caeruleus subsp. caeruleus TaxID=56427 RepID=A0A1K0FNX9_9ACTN|nr:hypothetical protein BG844_09150 [Couchioplanes caeruleus subsp. caeruleus]